MVSLYQPECQMISFVQRLWTSTASCSMLITRWVRKQRRRPHTKNSSMRLCMSSKTLINWVSMPAKSVMLESKEELGLLPAPPTFWRRPTSLTWSKPASSTRGCWRMRLAICLRTNWMMSRRCWHRYSLQCTSYWPRIMIHSSTIRSYSRVKHRMQSSRRCHLRPFGLASSTTTRKTISSTPKDWSLLEDSLIWVTCQAWLMAIKFLSTRLMKTNGSKKKKRWPSIRGSGIDNNWNIGI